MAVIDSRYRPTVLLRLALLGVSMFCLALLYTLSMGPMIWLSGHDYLSPATRAFLSDFYAPLWMISKYLPFLKQFLHWYISFLTLRGI